MSMVLLGEMGSTIESPIKMVPAKIGHVLQVTDLALCCKIFDMYDMSDVKLRMAVAEGIRLTRPTVLTRIVNRPKNLHETTIEKLFKYDKKLILLRHLMITKVSGVVKQSCAKCHNTYEFGE